MLRTPLHNRPRGIAIAIAILVLALTTVIVFAVATVGIHHLTLVKADSDSKQAEYTAVAGAQAGLRELVKDHSKKGILFQDEVFAAYADARYTVEIVNNFGGTGILTAHGYTVPQGFALIVSEGTVKGGRLPHKVAILVKQKTSGTFQYAIAAGGNVTLKAKTDLEGSIKSSGDINISANIAVNRPDGGGEARILAGANVNNSATVFMDPSATRYDVRARNNITNPPRIKNAEAIVPNDTSEDTLPFIADGRTTNTKSETETGEVLPNPDPEKLLWPGFDSGAPAPAGYVDHGSTTRITGTFDLGGKIHYFPKGVTFQSGSTITGEGTIVVGEGNSAVFEIPIGSGNAFQKMNVIAIDGHNGTVGGSSILFKAATFIQGLVYSHEDITSQANFRVKGNVISYKSGGGDVVHTGARLDVHIEPYETAIPGFEPWFGGGGASGSGPVDIEFCQRL